VLLFLPKLLSLLLILKNREARFFGGLIPLCASIGLEIFVSTLLAPVRMWFHSKFITLTLMGKQIKWGRNAELTTRQAGWKLFACMAFLRSWLSPGSSACPGESGGLCVVVARRGRTRFVYTSVGLFEPRLVWPCRQTMAAIPDPGRA